MKYTLGQVIKYKNDPDSDFGEIIGASLTSSGVIYTITFKEFDRETRTLVDAVKHIAEDDAVEKTAEGEENATSTS